MEKKISFGFSKISKKTNLLLNKIEQKDEKNKIELIKCLEGQTIQLVEKKEDETPLIIPLKDGGKTSAALLSLRTRQAVLNGEEIISNEHESKAELPLELNGNGIEDIDKRAAKELLAEITKGDDKDSTVSTLVLPLKAEDLPLDGATESTIADYESIPITQFGKAMLRGMGWKDQPKKKGAPIEEGPVLRPKGMGLGADKALKSKALLVPPEANEVLEIKKGACVLVLGGKNKDLYGQVEGLDDHAGRVIVKMALGGVKESFNEFMVQPVSKKEYSQYSKCINSIKYDEYKRMENEYGQIIMKNENLKNEDDKRPEENHSIKVKNENNDQKYNGHSKDDEQSKVSSRRNSTAQEYNSRKTERRSRSRDRRDEEHARCSTSHKKYVSRRSPSRRRSNSNDSLYSSDSNSNRNKHKKKSSKSKKSKKSKDKKQEKPHPTDSSSDDERRHKKKTKKSKRERSRSRSKVRR